MIKELVQNGKIIAKEYSIRLLIGDARVSIRDIDEKSIDAVFHDPYSPSKNPELWTVDFFHEIKRVVKEDSIITTYSSAPQIRNALLEAGFMVGTGPPVGRKREGTLASISGSIPVLSSESIDTIKSNIRSTPYRDPSLKDLRDDIIKRRLSEMRRKRKSLKSDSYR